MEPWPQGQSLFARDPNWLGGDGAYSQDLGDGKVLWLFGDSLVKTNRPGEGPREWFVHNTVAIQSGYDVAGASIQFFWGEEETEAERSVLDDLLGEEDPGPEPRSLIPGPATDHWYWPHDTFLVDGELLIFASEVRRVGDGPFAFEGVTWTAFQVEGPLTDPSRWKFNEVPTWGFQHGISLGIATVVHDGYGYTYGHRAIDDEMFGTLHEIFIARWQVEDIRKGDLREGQWWGGKQAGWGAHVKPEAIDKGAVIEWSVHHNPQLNSFVLVKLDWFGAADLVAQTAPAPEGPWSDTVVIYEPPEAKRESALLYAGKTHPWFARETGDIIVTYQYQEEDRPRMARAPGATKLSS